jgi:hypothetical protein
MLTTLARRPLAAAVAAALLCGVLAGCTGGSDGDGGASGSADGSGATSGSGSPSETPTNYLEVGKKITLTPQGSELGIGEKAAVAWAVDEKKTAVLEVNVTKVEQVPISRLSAWVLDKKSRSSTPYYVHAKIKNIGRSDLSGLPVPLYVAVGDNTLVSASSFESTFKPCPSTALPQKFKPGKGAATCWVYLAPDKRKMENVSFFTGPGFDPVAWSGKVVVVKDKKKSKKKSEKAGG